MCEIGKRDAAARLTITMPWPDKALWQNDTSSWRVKAAATRAARKTAWALMLEAGAKYFAITGRPRLVWSFHPPPLSRADLPNVIGAMKAAIDGVQDALQINDRKFLNAFPEEFGERVPGGKVVVTIEDNVT